MPKKELMKYSCRSMRVWACVTLGEEGMSPDVIKNRLRWLRESDRLDLRDTNKINKEHLKALKSSAENTVSCWITLNRRRMKTDPIYSGMGEHDDGDKFSPPSQFV